MAQRPPRDLDWIPDNSTDITVPSQTKQNVGWLIEKPARQFFNWLANRQSRWTHYFSGQSQEWIVIDSTNANEKDYDTLAAYIAASPAAGDKVLVKEDQTITAQVVLPANVTLKFLDGTNLLCATNIATSVLKLGSNPIIEGVLNIVLSQTGTTAKAVEIDGDNATGKINVENSSTGTLTTAYYINANKTGNKIDGFIQNTGGGTITNDYIDSSTETSNYLNLVNNSDDNIKTVTGIIISSGGIQTDGVNILKTKIIDIGNWNMDSTASIGVAHGLIYGNIRAVTALIRSDADTTHYDIDYANESGTGDNGSRVNSLNVVLIRRTGGFFDQVDFDAGSYNRGWITITYIA